MKLVRKSTKCFALLFMMSTAIWGMGCAKETPQSGGDGGAAATGGGPEAGSTLGGGINVPDDSETEGEADTTGEDNTETEGDSNQAQA